MRMLQQTTVYKCAKLKPFHVWPTHPRAYYMKKYPICNPDVAFPNTYRKLCWNHGSANKPEASTCKCKSSF